MGGRVIWKKIYPVNRIDEDGQGIVCGSRAHLQDESIASRTLVRTILMYGFHFCVWIFAVKNVRDTQCGFKVKRGVNRKGGAMEYLPLLRKRYINET